MDEMILPFFVGAVSDFEECDIDTTNLRKSINGEKCMIHMHVLSIEQFNKIRIKTTIEAFTYEQIQELVKNPEWGNL